MKVLRARRGPAGLGVLAVVAGVSVLGNPGTAMAAEATTSTAATCATGALPADVVGSPSVTAGSTEGMYFWHQTGGYRLMVTHPGTGKTVFSGSITASRAITGLKRLKLEKGDYADLSNNHRTLYFRLTDFGKLDGIAFGAECSKDVKVNLKINGVEANPSQVFLGAGKVDPATVPFTISRAAATAS